MTTIWAAELTGLHKGRGFATASGVCSLPWKNKAIYVVSIELVSYHRLCICEIQVILTELIGSILLSIIPRYVLEHKTLANNDPNKVIRGAIIGVAVLIIVLAGMDHSGAMFNPTLATLLVGGCNGFTNLQHFVVYWVTPVIGAAIGTSVYSMAEMVVHKEKKN